MQPPFYPPAYSQPMPPPQFQQFPIDEQQAPYSYQQQQQQQQQQHLPPQIPQYSQQPASQQRYQQDGFYYPPPQQHVQQQLPPQQSQAQQRQFLPPQLLPSQQQQPLPQEIQQPYSQPQMPFQPSSFQQYYPPNFYYQQYAQQPNMAEVSAYSSMQPYDTTGQMVNQYQQQQQQQQQNWISSELIKNEKKPEKKIPSWLAEQLKEKTEKKADEKENVEKSEDARKDFTTKETLETSKIESQQPQNKPKRHRYSDSSSDDDESAANEIDEDTLKHKKKQKICKASLNCDIILDKDFQIKFLKQIGNDILKEVINELLTKIAENEISEYYRKLPSKNLKEQSSGLFGLFEGYKSDDDDDESNDAPESSDDAENQKAKLDIQKTQEEAIQQIQEQGTPPKSSLDINKVPQTSPSITARPSTTANTSQESVESHPHTPKLHRQHTSHKPCTPLRHSLCIESKPIVETLQRVDSDGFSRPRYQYRALTASELAELNLDWAETHEKHSLTVQTYFPNNIQEVTERETSRLFINDDGRVVDGKVSIARAKAFIQLSKKGSFYIVPFESVKFIVPSAEAERTSQSKATEQSASNDNDYDKLLRNAVVDEVVELTPTQLFPGDIVQFNGLDNLYQITF